jgi:hypothetical protein
MKELLILLVIGIFLINPYNAKAEQIPDFFDDFSDGKFNSRTGVDPWDRPLPEWTSYTGQSGQHVTENHFTASNGYLETLNSNNLIEIPTLPQSIYPYGKWEFDVYVPDGISISIGTSDSSFTWQRRSDGHNLFTMSTPLWGGHLLGWNAPTSYPSGGNKVYDLNSWHHVEIYRYENGTILIIEDGKRRPYGWANEDQNPVSSPENPSGTNIELFDNPRLYHADSYGGDGSSFPDTTIKSNFTKISVGYVYSGDYSVRNLAAIDNIKFYSFKSTFESRFGNISGTVTDSNGSAISNATVTDGTRSTITTSDGAFTIKHTPIGTYTVTAKKTGYTTQSKSAAVQENQTTTIDFILSKAKSPPILSPIAPKSTSIGSLLQFTITASDPDNDPLTFSATGLPTGASLDVTSGAFTWTPSNTQEGTHVVTFVVSDGSLTDSEAVTITVNGAIELPALTVIDNRLRESTPDSVLGDTTWIDVGIESNGNYRSMIWFNLSQFNSTDHIEHATLSLFWFYEERNQSTDVSIYRPTKWDADYVTWNTRTNGVAWNNPGGDWYDRNNVAQGAEPYVTVTFPVDTPPDYMYHDFDVTELVQSYINGTYDNTGFFIKANEIDNSYIAFYSSEWSNADQRPKLTITNTPEDGPVNHAPVLDSIGDRSVNADSPLQFTISATDPDSDPLTYSATNLPTSATFNPTTRTFSWTPCETQVGSYQVHFEVTDGSLTGSEDITITVNDAQKPIITNVNAASITDTSATGKWNTDEPSDSLVKYGTVSGVYTAEVYNAADVVSHSIQPTGLSPHTTYYYVVNSTDPNGNSNESVEYDFTTESQDTTPTSVTYPTATPSIIPDDTDNDPRWGESSQLNVTITDDDGIASVTIDLSAIGGSSAQHMTNIGGNIWSVNTSAAAGTSPQTYDLRVNATDIYGYSNTSVVISLMVVKNGDVNGDGKVDFKGDVIYLKKHIRGVSGYEALIEEVADVTGDGRVDFAGDVVYLARHIKDVPGYEILH